MRWVIEGKILRALNSAFHCDICNAEHSSIAVRKLGEGHYVLMAGPHWFRGPHKTAREAIERYKNEVNNGLLNSLR